MRGTIGLLLIILGFLVYGGLFVLPVYFGAMERMMVFAIGTLIFFSGLWMIIEAR